jgi:hypothetical protein
MGNFGLNFGFRVLGVPQPQFVLRNMLIRDWSEDKAFWKNEVF